jgi:hypothetical protein
MESALEGTVQRLLGAKLQPIQLAKAAVREMERQQLVGPSGIEAPNGFDVHLHPSDFASFERWRSALERELASYLERYAGQRGWQQPGPPIVSVRPTPGTPRSRPRVEAHFIDSRPDAPVADAPVPPPESTRAFPRAVPAVDHDASVDARPLDRPAWLVNEQGERFPLRSAVTTLGRALENQVVLSDPRVSRFHAEIRRAADRFVLRDLGSSNGTTVGGSRAESADLDNGDLISLGGYRLVFETGDGAWDST